jgi:hypothetical protein
VKSDPIQITRKKSDIRSSTSKFWPFNCHSLTDLNGPAKVILGPTCPTRAIGKLEWFLPRERGGARSESQKMSKKNRVEIIEAIRSAGRRNARVEMMHIVSNHPVDFATAMEAFRDGLCSYEVAEAEFSSNGDFVPQSKPLEG